jgi:hypothetical protein
MDASSHQILHTVLEAYADLPVRAMGLAAAAAVVVPMFGAGILTLVSGHEVCNSINYSHDTTMYNDTALRCRSSFREL